MLKKVVVLGPESTGKSTLCEMLANHFNTVWVEEYAREFLLKQAGDYSFDDLLIIAKGQLANEDRVVKELEAPLVFIDTDMQVMKVWCEFVFGAVHPFIEESLKERTYDLYLLCNVDLPWVKDELREYPDLATRQQLYQIYRERLQQANLPWIDISGDYAARLQTAIHAVNSIL